MKVYNYSERTIIEFDDKTRLSLATNKYGDTLKLLVEEIKETNYKLGNAYDLINDNEVRIHYWNVKTKETQYILVDYDFWLKHKEMTFTLDNRGYVHFCIPQTKNRPLLHHAVTEYGEAEKQNNLVVDHINGNKLDNRSVNLRIVSISLNNKNKSYFNSKNKSTGIRGISYTSRKDGYRVRWIENGKECVEYFNLDELEKAVEFNIKIRIKNDYNIRL